MDSFLANKVDVPLVPLVIAWLLSVCLAFCGGQYLGSRNDVKAKNVETVDASADRTTENPIRVPKLKLKMKQKNDASTTAAGVEKVASSDAAVSVQKMLDDGSVETEATMSLLAIIGLKGYDNGYAKRTWDLVRTGPNIHFWRSSSQPDGILLRGTSVAAASASDIVDQLVKRNLTTGLEGIAFKSELLHASNEDSSTIRRLVCRSGKMTASKRDFIVETRHVRQSDGSIVLISRSITQDDDAQMAHKRRGSVRGKVYCCGYYLRPLRDGEGQGCEINYGCHIDMSGNSLNSSKMESLMGHVLTLLDRLNRVVSSATPCEGTQDETSQEGFSSVAPTPTNMSSSDLSKFNSSSSPCNSLSAGSDSIPFSAAMYLSNQQIIDLFVVAKTTMERIRLLHTSVLLHKNRDSNIIPPAASPASPAASPSASSPSRSTFSKKFSSTSSANPVPTTTPKVGGSIPSVPTTSASGAEAISWNVINNSGGIVVSECVRGSSPVGTFQASCSIDAHPSIVSKLLRDCPHSVDALLEGKSILATLNGNTYIQWLAYGPIWPVGARDFLVVTSEETFADESGFAIGSASIDDICEADIDDSDWEDEIEGVATEGKKESKLSERYNRSRLKLAGYVGTLNASGGTDLCVIVDVDISTTYVPSWLLQVLTQYGLSEMLERIRTVVKGPMLPCGSLPSLKGAEPSQLGKMLNNMQSRNEKLQNFLPVDVAPGAVPSPPVRRNSGLRNRFRSISSASATGAPVLAVNTPLDDTPPPVSSPRGSESPTTTTSPLHTLSEQLVDESLSLLKQYLGIQPSEIEFKWTQQNNKSGITVYSSPIPGSPMFAVRAKTVFPGVDKHQLITLLTDDSRMGEYDDMFDGIDNFTRIDEKTVIRRIFFKGIWPTAARDFLVHTTWQEIPDVVDPTREAIFFASKSPALTTSFQQKSLRPPYVRGNIQVSGYYIRPLVGDEVGCEVSIAAHTELGGSLPTSVINVLAATAPFKLLSAIREITKRK